MARGLTKKQIKKDEFMEAATDAGEWLEDNWKTVLIWVCGLVILAVLISGWHLIGKSREKAAQEFLGQGMNAFSAASDIGTGTTDDYNRAIDLFLQASDKAGSGPTGRVADLYRGIALSKTGRTEEAITVLQDVSQNADFTLIVQTSQAVLAGIHEASGNYEEAEAIYLELSAATDGTYPPAQALLNAGMARLAMGREAEARELFEGLVRDYPQSAAAAQAGRLLESQ
jgi:tetratricopeptide (TPR) repeat protein